MKKHLQLFLLIFFFPVILQAQLVWNQKATFGGSGRHRAVGMCIGSRGYMGTGHINSTGDIQYEDWWEYDPGSNSWTQKADFGGGKRYHATGFSIGNRGYVGTGRDITFSNTNDWWEYNPVTNTWTQKAPLPGPSRRGAVAFSIGNKGYLGTGSGYQDFYEYDPATNTWTQKPPLPGPGRTSAVGFSIGTKGYIGTGEVGGPSSDFWCFDPAANSWSQKASFAGLPRMEAGGFSMGGKGYIGTGDDYSSGNNYGDFWCYDPSTNSWTQIADFGGTARRYLTCFSIGNRGYAGLGTSGTNFQDFWEYGNTSAVEELDNDPYNISIYPNPVGESAVIAIANGFQASDHLQFMMYDVSGKLARSMELTSDKVSLQRDDLKAGTYLYQVIKGSTSVASGSVIIQ